MLGFTQRGIVEAGFSVMDTYARIGYWSTVHLAIHNFHFLLNFFQNCASLVCFPVNICSTILIGTNSSIQSYLSSAEIFSIVMDNA